MLFVLLFLFFAPGTLSHVTAGPFDLVQTGLLVQKREDRTYCDSNSKFFCIVPDVCISGRDGYVGCCTATTTTCAPRTTCIAYTAGVSASCDHVTGGCVYCSNSESAYCTTQYRDHKYVLGCGTAPLITTYSSTESAVPAVSKAGLSTTTESAAPSAAPTSASQPTQTSSKSGALTTTSSTSLLPSLSSSSPSSALNTPVPTQSVKNSPLSSSRGFIVGVIFGAAAGTVLLLVLLFVLWKYWVKRRSARKSKEKPNRAGYTIGSGDDDISNPNNIQVDEAMGISGQQGPAELEEQSQRPVGNTTGSEQASAGAAGQDSTRYHCVNPDSTESVQGDREGQPPSWTMSPIPGVAEAPADVPAWRSPSISTMASPAPSNSSLWMVGPGATSPRTPSHYVAYSPSVYTYSGQPPSSLARGRADEKTMAQHETPAELEAKEGDGTQ